MRVIGAAVTAAVIGVCLTVGAGSAQADAVWLCKPGSLPNPCLESLETTVEEPGGGSRVENPELPPDPKVDCFYVYPTVSGQPTRNASLSKDPELVAMARLQASRFSQQCRVFAPVYRQSTLATQRTGSATAGAVAENVAYADIRAAWKEYLARDNHGRGVVLLSHSQGTRMLRQLVREEIDADAGVRRRLVSAVLLGGNVLVRKGQTSGGDFRNVRVCQAPTQNQCVVAFSVFNEPPPPAARFGRPPATDTSGVGLPAGNEYEVVCTNPASLQANARRELTSLVRSEPFPGLLGLELAQMYNGPPPRASTPWIQPRERYSGRCERVAGADVLMIEPVGDARRLRPAPDANWGLHLGDMNLPLGELVDLVGQQVASYLTPPRVRPPARVTLPLAFTRGRDSVGRRCASSAITAVVDGRDRNAVRRAEFRAGTRRVAIDQAAPFRAVLRRSVLRRGVVNAVRVDVVTFDGRRARVVRHVRVCA